MSIQNIFKRDFENYEGVRPVNIYFLRLLYFLMFVFVGLDAWKTIFTHQGSWDPTRAVAWCVWAAYASLSFFGLLNPLRWLPIIIFMIFYKTLWIIVVAYPMWSKGTLAGSPAEGMAQVFIAAPFLALIIPWKYVFEKYILISRKNK